MSQAASQPATWIIRQIERITSNLLPRKPPLSPMDFEIFGSTINLNQSKSGIQPTLSWYKMKLFLHWAITTHHIHLLSWRCWHVRLQHQLCLIRWSYLNNQVCKLPLLVLFVFEHLSENFSSSMRPPNIEINLHHLRRLHRQNEHKCLLRISVSTIRAKQTFTSTCSMPNSSVYTLFGMRWRAARFLLSWPYPVMGDPILTLTWYEANTIQVKHQNTRANIDKCRDTNGQHGLQMKWYNTI